MALTIFLTIRLLADMLTSRAFEVWWLIVSFVWGILNLWMRPSLGEQGRDTWTFGQVMAFLVIFAPLITLVEGYVKDGIEFIHIDSRAPSSLIGLVIKPTTKEDDFIHPHPHHDYYKERFSFPTLVYAALMNVVITSSFLLYALQRQEIRPIDIISPYSPDNNYFILAPPIPVVVGFLGMCVLLSLVCEIRRPSGKAYRRWCRFLQFSLFTGILMMLSLGLTFVFYLALVCAGIYLVLSIVHMVRRFRWRRKAQKEAHGL
ncbi:hypothetical protein G6514_006593 [Epicoccum nigrum]|nr:hypothetical protein G6514_006593 [Epicoccum nigrum]